MADETKLTENISIRETSAEEYEKIILNHADVLGRDICKVINDALNELADSGIPVEHLGNITFEALAGTVSVTVTASSEGVADITTILAAFHKMITGRILQHLAEAAEERGTAH